MNEHVNKTFFFISLYEHIHRLNNTSMQNRYFATIDQLTDRHSHISYRPRFSGIQYFGSECMVDTPVVAYA